MPQAIWHDKHGMRYVGSTMATRSTQHNRLHNRCNAARVC